jgi:trk system potassium uptake protein TrkH
MIGDFFRRRHPAQLIVLAFALGIFVGAGLLMLPVSSNVEGSPPFLTAVFTSTSAICVTGLIVVDTPTYWTQFGQVVILALIQIGGLGIMTLTSLLALLVARRLGLRGRIATQAERAVPELSNVRRLVVSVVLLSASFELVGAVVLTLRFWLSYDYGFGAALYRGAFHSVSAFNNAGFALWSDSLVGFVTDGVVSVTVPCLVIAGGLGFPVWLELRRRGFQPRRWTLHTKLTLVMTPLLIAFGFFAMLGFEWSNDRTIGQLSPAGKLLASFFQGVMPRTAGFNSVANGELSLESQLVTDMLMFVGAGSASTGGGIKVTTFALLLLVVLAEARGDPNVTAFSRRVPDHVGRQALTVAFIAINAVVIATLALMAVSPFSLSQTLYEALSAFGTVGLSTGITGQLNEAGQLILVVLMYLGRTGPYTLAVALALRERRKLYRYPEERPIIG